MAMPSDPILRRPRVRAWALQDPATCPWCLGQGSYLEPMRSGLDHDYLPIVCHACGGSGCRPG
jgi:DnaJ-class molecular chaperone